MAGAGARTGIIGAGANVGVDADEDAEEPVGEAGGGAGAMARNLRLTYSSLGSSSSVPGRDTVKREGVGGGSISE